MTKSEKEQLQAAEDELKKALGEETEEEDKEPTILTRLAKGMASLLNRSNKDEPTKKTDAKTEPVKEEGTLTKSEDDDKKDEVIDVTKLLQAFSTDINANMSVIQKSVGGTDERLVRVEEAIDLICGQLATIMKSHALLHKAFETSPKSTPMLGVTTISKGKGSEEPPATQGTKLSRDDIQGLIQDAVMAGELVPQTLGMFASNPNGVLANIPDTVAKSHGIPRSL